MGSIPSCCGESSTRLFGKTTAEGSHPRGVATTETTSTSSRERERKSRKGHIAEEKNTLLGEATFFVVPRT